MKRINGKLIGKYKNYLVEEEKSEATLEKYIRDVKAFASWLGQRSVDKHTVLEYKSYITEHYKPASVNSMLSSINGFFSYNQWYDCMVKTLKIQRQIFASDKRELSKAEYERLLFAAKSEKSRRLYLLMQTICATGIRVSELRFVTVEHRTRKEN